MEIAQRPITKRVGMNRSRRIRSMARGISFTAMILQVASPLIWRARDGDGKTLAPRRPTEECRAFLPPLTRVRTRCPCSSHHLSVLLLRHPFHGPICGYGRNTPFNINRGMWRAVPWIMCGDGVGDDAGGRGKPTMSDWEASPFSIQHSLRVREYVFYAPFASSTAGDAPHELARDRQRERQGMRIEVLVIGCAKCKRLERNVQLALDELGIDEKIERIEDIEEMKRRGTMRVPILYIDGEMKAVGTVPSVEEIKTLLLSASS